VVSAVLAIEVDDKADDGEEDDEQNDGGSVEPVEHAGEAARERGV
jgi:hypothetical protein